MSDVIVYASALAVVVLGVSLLISVFNGLAFPRLRRRARGGGAPRVSVLVPARNEADRIAGTVRSLLAQDYPDFEVVILDDASTDSTASIALDAGGGDSRLRVVPGTPLPRGWAGKPWACQQLSQLARGEIFLFTDADVRWDPAALGATVDEFRRAKADLLTVWPRQTTMSWAERLVVPMILFGIIAYLPVWLVHRTRWPWLATANGQCMVFAREAYFAIGGHSAVRSEVLEDILLAQVVKRRGLRLRLADSAGLLHCRMYLDWPTVRDGFAKNMLATYGNSALRLGLMGALHWWLYVWPWLWLALGSAGSRGEGWPLIPIVQVLLGLTVRTIAAAVTREKLSNVLWMPLSIMVTSAIGFRSVWWKWRYGGPRWKGRMVIPSQDLSRPLTE
jgi:chlorobactene glucosyltransferase